jgi:8-oxo-dGTP pyrophosphatase MutT (NUDIX family)
MDSQKWKTKMAFSAGGVVYKIENGETHVVLIARQNKNNKRIWCLPKGTIESKENKEQTALREVGEETGLKGEIVREIGQLDYWFYWQPESARYHKTVYFYLIKFLNGNTQSHDCEVDAVEWFPIEKAIQKLAFKNEKEILEKARKSLNMNEEG